MRSLHHGAKHLYRSLAPLKLREIVNEVRRKMTFEWLTQTISNRTSIRYAVATLSLFYHPYNCGVRPKRTAERSVELALAFMWLRKTSGSIMEIGAVTPYYLAPADPLALPETASVSR
jgi:hypothetical protein